MARGLEIKNKSKTIHLWHIYLQLPEISTKCKWIYQSHGAHQNWFNIAQILRMSFPSTKNPATFESRGVGFVKEFPSTPESTRKVAGLYVFLYSWYGVYNSPENERMNYKKNSGSSSSSHHCFRFGRDFRSFFGVYPWKSTTILKLVAPFGRW